MDPFQINAAYRQDQLLEEARAETLARTARGSARPASGDGLLGRLLRSARQVSRPRQASSPRKATV